jgi:microsomal dipeptidase-like Zn-dependent dipeptidase
MKKPLFKVLVGLIFIAIAEKISAQDPIKLPVDPRNIKVIDKIDPAFQIKSALPDCYIMENRFWANEVRSQKIVTDECYSVDNRFKWRPVRNADGSYYIASLFNTSSILIHEKSRLVIPRVPGISDGGNPQDGYYVKVPPAGGFASTSAIKIVDKWWLRNISGYEYWFVHFDRTDSFRINMLPVSWMPATPISYSLDNLNGWILGEGAAAGHAFAGQPSTVTHIPYYNSAVIPPMPLGGSYWRELERDFHSLNTKTVGGYINTARPGSDRWIRPDETKTGTLFSSPFFVCYEKMTFKIAGTEDAANIRFEVLQEVSPSVAGAIAFSDGHYKVISTYTGHNNDIARMIVVNMREQKHKKCRFRIIDNSTAGHIIVDDIDNNYSGALSSAPRPADPVLPSTAKPVFGAIDMHTHPMSYLGMGGKLMHGGLDGDPAVALGNCNCTHGGWGTDNTCGNYFRAEIVNLIDEHYDEKITRYRLEDIKVPHNDHPHDGFPNLTHWPAQNSMTHQQMWYEWMRRAKDGGLTSIIALTVNSEVLGRALGGDAPYDDKTTADRQIDELIAFVNRHRDFLDTVTSPARMRQVINEGRMAVIIGMEIDNIGNFYKNVPVTTEQIRAEITRLKNKGVRYIFPIHVTDNKFGGAAVYKTLFNYSNKYATGQPITALPPELYPPILPGNLFNVETAPDRNVTFRLEGGIWAKLRAMRPLLEVIDAGGFPILPPPADVPSLVIKPIVDPILLALKFSSQYQLAKKIFLDRHPELNRYDSIYRTRTDRGGHRNIHGLFAEGDFAVKEMMRQGMMIDVDHASEKSVSDMLRIAMRNMYPVNSGHNGLRGTNANEKERTRGQLDTIRTLGGMMGIGWEEQSPSQFNSIYAGHLGAMGNRNTTFGSDIDGYASTPKRPANPSQYINYTNRTNVSYLTPYVMPGSPRVWDYNTEGMAHIGMVPDFFQAIHLAGMSKSNMNQLLLSSEYFAQMWERCENRAPLVER